MLNSLPHQTNQNMVRRFSFEVCYIKSTIEDYDNISFTFTQFKQKRRFVLGLREVLKHAKLKKIKAVIVAPNLERISSEGTFHTIPAKKCSVVERVFD